ncbi:MAG TPA: hypothetical protein VFV34_06615 [Blastocatellia bacterium]|nr:hypothetical protein [Blastocatellia bacterium]
MGAEFYLIALLVLLGALYFVAVPALGAYRKYRGRRIVVCPETRKNVAVEVNASIAAASAVVGEPRLRLSDCTRWPERRDCGQECLPQIEMAPEDCLVRNILTRFFEGKSCAFCGKTFGEIHWPEHQPAIIGSDGRTSAVRDIPAEQIPDLLLTHSPVCWDCHIAETFRREHPDLVIDWPSRPDREGTPSQHHQPRA